LDAAAGIGQAPHPPAGLGKLRLDPLISSRSEAPGGRRQAIFPGQQAALLRQARFGDGRRAGSCRPRAEARKAFDAAIGSRAMTARNSTIASPTLRRSPSAYVHALQADFLDRGAPHAIALRQRVGEGAAALQLDRAVERIGRLDRLELTSAGWPSA
jgi:hypothetical protein